MTTKGKSRGKSTVAQQVVGTAAMGMPAPVKGIIATRWGARITLVVIGLALATGILSVQWSGNIPHLQFNKKRAQEVGKEVRHEVDEIADRVSHEKGDHGLGHHLPIKISR